jgi:small subunit ribosomal protein S20
MAHTESAKKRIKTNEKARVRNKSQRSAMKTHLKRVEEAVASGDAGRARAELALAMQKLDKAAKTRVIHPNQAARKKSRIARAVARLK